MSRSNPAVKQADLRVARTKPDRLLLGRDQRLDREAEAAGIIVSGLVRELCDVDAGYFVALGERRLKGFPEQVPVFRLE